MSRQEETVYLLTNREGFLVRVPESKLGAFQRVQAQRRDMPLSKAEQRLKDRLAQELLGGRG